MIETYCVKAPMFSITAKAACVMRALLPPPASYIRVPLPQLTRTIRRTPSPKYLAGYNGDRPSTIRGSDMTLFSVLHRDWEAEVARVVTGF